jgi:hypothetical protein
LAFLGYLDWAASNRRLPDIRKSRALLPIGGLPTGVRRNSIALSPTMHEQSTQPSSSLLHQAVSSSSSSSPSNSKVNLTEGASHASSTVNSRLPPLKGTVFARERSGSMPNPITVVRDPKDYRAYNITMSPNFDDAFVAGDTPSTGEVHQTFPETPNAFSPMFTPGSQASPQRKAADANIGTIPEAPESPMSATLPSVSFGVAGATLAQQVMLSRAATSATRTRPTQKVSRRMHPYARATGTPSDSEEETGGDGQSRPPEPELVERAPNVSLPASPSSSGPVQSQTRHEPIFEAPVFASDVFSRPVAPPSESRAIAPDALPDSPAQLAPMSTVPHALSRITAQNDSPLSPSLSLPPSYESVILDRPDAGRSAHSPSDNESLDVVPEIDTRSEISTPPSSAHHGGVAGSRAVGQQSSSSRNATAIGSRMRRRLPIGPREPSQSSGIETSGSTTAPSGTIRHKLDSAAAPKFHTPPLKWRGCTMDAAKWTFTSDQLQGIVSRAIKQSAEASSIRLLQLDTLDQDLPEETHRLEMLAMDLKSRYKFGAKKRWALLSSVSDDPELGNSSAVNDLIDVSATLDHITEELHVVDTQMSQLQSLRDVHSRSALAMALRKLNNSFLKQVAETQLLHSRVEALETERDEAWKQAEDIAIEFDELQDKMFEAGYIQSSGSDRAANHRSSRISAMRKSCARASRAGLRSSSMRRSRSSVASSFYRTSTSTMSMTSAARPAPPVPPIPSRHGNLGIVTGGDMSSRSSRGTCAILNSLQI